MLLFEDTLKLLEGSAFSAVNTNDSYLFLESNTFLTEYIVPTISSNDFDFENAKRIIADEGSKDKSVSFYISEALDKEYSKPLSRIEFKLDFVDTYMLKTIDSPLKVATSSDQFLEVVDESYEEYLKACLECFPTWQNEAEYSKYFYDLSKSDSKNKFKNFVLKSDTVKSFASVIMDKELNLAYIHNAGTPDKFRRNGYFSELNKYMCNYLLEQQITRVFVIVTPEDGASGAYEKLGFVMSEKYYIYS